MKYFIDSTDYIFNTKVYQKIEVNNKKDANVLNKAIKLMRSFEEKLSFYKENSDISKINRNAGKSYVRVSQDTFNIIKASKEYSKMTNGLFDITIAPLVKAWAINTLSPKVLNKLEIEKIITLVNYDNILINEADISVMLKKTNMQIDLGGIAKGYIADKIIDFYRENNIENVIINIGGNVKVLGKKSENELWNIGIFEPKKHSTENICCVSLENTSVVTSGAYERAFMYNGELYHHILNPATGYPSKSDLKSISIISNDSLKADGLSTPLFIMGKYKASEFMKKNNISGIMITDDDKIIITKNLLKDFKLIKDYPVLTF